MFASGCHNFDQLFKFDELCFSFKYILRTIIMPVAFTVCVAYGTAHGKFYICTHVLYHNAS